MPEQDQNNVEMAGRVTQKVSSVVFRIVLGDSRRVTAHLSDDMRTASLNPGDEVTVQFPSDNPDCPEIIAHE